MISNGCIPGWLCGYCDKCKSIMSASDVDICLAARMEKIANVNTLQRGAMPTLSLAEKAVDVSWEKSKW